MTNEEGAAEEEGPGRDEPGCLEAVGGVEEVGTEGEDALESGHGEGLWWWCGVSSLRCSSVRFVIVVNRPTNGWLSRQQEDNALRTIDRAAIEGTGSQSLGRRCIRTDTVSSLLWARVPLQDCRASSFREVLAICAGGVGVRGTRRETCYLCMLIVAPRMLYMLVWGEILDADLRLVEDYEG